MNADDLLRDAIGDAVGDVEPTDRLSAIRLRAARRTTRRRWYVVAGSAVLAAAVVVGVAVVVRPDDTSARPPVTAPSSTAPTPPTSAPPTAEPTPTEPSSTAPPLPTEAAALYFIGDTPDGPRLFREFQQVPEYDARRDVSSVATALESPADPDYRTAWPAGSVDSAQIVEGEIRVFLGENATRDPLALQQLRATLTAATGIQELTWYPAGAGNPFGVERDDDLLALVSISDPVEGRRVAGTFTARGVANSFEANVPWQVVDGDGRVVVEGSTMAAGAYDRLYPWETRIDVSQVRPGNYTLVVTLDDPGAADDAPPYVDTRTIVVEAPPTTVVYRVGPGPDGPDAPVVVLTRETLPGDLDPLDALMTEPTDPDYRTLWPAGTLASYDVEDGRIVVQVNDGPVNQGIARQQLIYTLQEAVGERLPVDLTWTDGRDTPIRPVDRAPELEVLSHLIVDSPAEGLVVRPLRYASLRILRPFVASGVAAGFEGTVYCTVLGAAGNRVWEGTTTSGGLLSATLDPWELTVDLQGVPPGDYTFTCTTDDPTAGTEGRGHDVDTRSIRVE